MREADKRAEGQAFARAILRAELRALVEAHPQLRGSAAAPEDVLDAAGIVDELDEQREVDA